MDSHAQVVVEFIRRLKLRRVCLYGHSMSGAVAVEVARTLPGRVARLVLSEPNLDPGGGATSRAIAQQGRAEYVARGHARMVRAAVRRGQHAWAATMAGSLPSAIHREASSLVLGTQPSWRQVLAGLAMPRTVLFGARSLPDPDMRPLRALGIKVRVVPRAGHDMAVENPVGLARALAVSIA